MKQSLKKQIAEICEWNDKVNSMFWRQFTEYQFNELKAAVRIFNEEVYETIKALILSNETETADWLWDMFFVSVWELYKQWIDPDSIFSYLSSSDKLLIPYCEDMRKCYMLLVLRFSEDIAEKIIQEIIDSNNTRFSEWCHIKDGKFIKWKDYKKPNFNFLCETI